MDFDKKTQIKTEKYKFCDRFLKKFETLAKAYDAELKKLRSIEKEIKGASHGVCNNAYNVRFITPSDISTYVSNLDKSLAAGLIHPTVGDCEMFAVESAKKFVEANGGKPIDTIIVANQNALTLCDLVESIGSEVFKKDVYTHGEMTKRTKFVKDDIKSFDNMHFTAATRALIGKLPTIIEKHSEVACSVCDVRCKHELGIYIGNFILFALKFNLVSLMQLEQYAIPQVTFDSVPDRDAKFTAATVQGYSEMYKEATGNELTRVIQESENGEKKEVLRPFDEVYTECFHNCKVGSEIRSVVPFNMNFRDIALSDDHEFYKNTELALEYIVTNPRSPFNQLIVKFTDKDKKMSDPGEADMLLRMMFGEYTKKIMAACGDPFYRPDVQFPSDPNWMDKITYGNAYYDMNYRRDNPGNQHTDPITAKFDMLAKMFMPCCHETDSTKLAYNVLRIVDVMKAIIATRSNTSEWDIPRQLSTEMLAFLGDMLTRTLMKLYHLNTIVIDFSDDMPDTMIPGYFGESCEYIDEETGDIVKIESFIVEADAPPAMKVSTPEGKEATGKAKIDNMAKKFWAAFVNWLNKVAIKYFDQWERVNKSKIDKARSWREKVNTISQVLGHGFEVNVNGYTDYELHFEALEGIANNASAEVDKAISDANIENYIPASDGNTDKLDELEKTFYPNEIAEDIMSTKTKTTSSAPADKEKAQAATEEARDQILANYLLYGKLHKEKPTFSNVNLSGDQLLKMYNALIEAIGENGQSKMATSISTYQHGLAAINKKLTDAMTESGRKLFQAQQSAAAKVTETAGSPDTSNDAEANKLKEEFEKLEKKDKALVSIARRVAGAEKVVNQAAFNSLLGIPKSKDKKVNEEAYQNSFWSRVYGCIEGVIIEYDTRGNANAQNANAENNGEGQQQQAQNQPQNQNQS